MGRCPGLWAGGMFVIGALPAFLVIYIGRKWMSPRRGCQGPGIKNLEKAVRERHLGKPWNFALLVVLMFAFNSFSHGTQDCIRHF